MDTPKGYKYAAIEGNLKYSGRLDLALIVSDTPCVAAGTFTTNKFQAAPVVVAKELVENSTNVQGIMINAGSANACTGEEGLANCKRSLELVSSRLGLRSDAILPASTGVIGLQFDMEKWEAAAPVLVDAVGKHTGDDFANAIMTTDTFPKTASRSIIVDGKTVTIAGMAKGAGMICPNMATMLGTVITDAQIDGALWKRIVKTAVDGSFNCVSVDGDTSTNDCVLALANGASEAYITDATETEFQQAVTSLMRELSYQLVQDGEGATKVMQILVSGAKNNAEADMIARTVGHSPLVKTAIYGKDANWGRIVAAIGRSGADFEATDVQLTMCGIELFKNGQPSDVDFDTLLKPYLEERDILIDIVVGNGEGKAELFASDLTHEYISINADYRS
ncbi:bifunctional glutamate N-acetyltransferase/amino-acid acetyltransferase ArgJ [Halodesulfovibrio sp.]|uniref:bifunctional glutamate N-acetyltransferase/amino-acid acetyltransferase ArgJ n=1 Tax=Halodesulfovibrio sp. TaxID=1912772 RepID=UPI0025D2D16B|nr:bifunctional glutamate N-acetyltransferase/amino-acid acetyltransferase ArgJ [Halodesulfovibrio sp.]MCT4626250.1 bifunctional glutamate N-acetyltransferase/amino-acid acetyltransferase ArgJ [Halodesulfovibrio sp.]